MSVAMDSYLRQLIALVRASLSARLKRAWLFLGVLLLIGATLDFLTLGALVPFLQIVSADTTAPLAYFSELSAFVGVRLTPGMITVILGSGLAVLILLNALLKTFCNYLAGRVTAGIGAQVARRCFAVNLYQSYERHTLANSAELITRMARIDVLVGGVLQPLFQGSAAVLTLIVTLLGMLIFQPLPTLMIALMVGSAFAFFHRLARRRLSRNADELGFLGVHLNKLLQQSTASFRDVKLFGLQPVILSDFVRNDYRARIISQESFFLGAAPKLVIEGVGLAILILVSVLLSLFSLSGNLVLTIGFIVYGFQRLLPAAQQLFAGAASLKAQAYVIADIADWLLPEVAMTTQQLRIQRAEYDQVGIAAKSDAFVRLECRHLCYTYPGHSKGIGPIDLTIQRGEMLGLVGSTGSGKSTLVDLIMGLLQPSSGQVLVNGDALHWNFVTQTADPTWTCQISHVPQRLYLQDGSIKDNIRLGSGIESIDEARLNHAIELSCLRSTIAALPRGLETQVGEAGIRLSGGQCQRIGIARALYRGGSLLVLDEATSALDQQTEAQVMEGLRSLSGLTIIAIAHRLSSLQSCDNIARFDQPGGPLTSTSFAELRAQT
jgi:ATP-binding cassette subfamily B protein